MKLKNFAVAAAALVLAVGMTACGSSSSTAASSAASSEAASSEVASSEAASSEEASSEVTGEQTAEYTIYNTTGATVTELYLYEVGSEDKGENYAADGLADGESIVLTRVEDASVTGDIKYVLEFVSEGSEAQTFETLSFEVAPISLLSADAMTGATPISFSAPQQ